MDRKLIPWIVVALSMPVVIILMKWGDWFNMFLYGIFAFCSIPLAIYGVYMWSTGNGWRWINGYDWSSMSENQKRGVASRVGKYMAVSMVLFMVSLPILLSNIVIGLVLIAISSVIILIPFVYHRNDAYEPPPVGNMNAISGVTLVCITCLAAPFISMGSSDSVTVTFGEESFTVSAPMFDHSFRYDDIVEHELDKDFDKGSRVWGFGTPFIMSGTFENGEFGRYELASFAKVDYCIVISVGGEIYAFNQSTDEATQACYEELLSRIS